MLAKRIIPCLDVAGGRVVKGVHFVNLRDAGDPVELGRRYYEEGADELVFLDITATVEERKTTVEWVRRVADSIFIPFTVGGGISSREQIQELLRAGADKVSINSAAVRDPQFIRHAASAFGSQCIVLAADVKRRGQGWKVFIHGGRLQTDRDALEWLSQAQELGAGEILLTSMDCDGTQRGYDLELLQAVSRRLRIPVIASGGAGHPQHLLQALRDGGADAVLAASIFHYGSCSVTEVKNFLAQNGIPVRLATLKTPQASPLKPQAASLTAQASSLKPQADALDWSKMDGLIPAIVQDARSGRLLMLGFMNREAFNKTLETEQVTFWSRVQNKLWTKGETSGHYLRVKEIRQDCDADALLVLVEPMGPTCHRGTVSCFGEDSQFAAFEFLAYLEKLIEKRKAEMPKGSYTSALFQKGLDEIAKKLGEEAVEVVISAGQSPNRSVEEAADLIYHLLVFLSGRNIRLEEVVRELERRHAK